MHVLTRLLAVLQNAAERLRMALMAPVAAARCLLFWGVIIAYGMRQLGALLGALELLLTAARPPPGFYVRALDRKVAGNDRLRHAVLVPVTQRAATALLWCCGDSVRSARVLSTPARCKLTRCTRS